MPERKSAANARPAVKPARTGSIDYPTTARVTQVDDYHGVKVEDPFRWLEDDRSAQTAEWVKAQNKVTRAFIDAIPERQAIHKRLTELWNFEKYTTPFKRGERLFYQRNSGLQNQDVLYVIDKPGAIARVLLDPNTLSADGTVALSGLSITDDGKLMAYGLSKAGSDWIDWHVRNIDTGEDLPDLIKWSKFSNAAWLLDGSGFYYCRYDEPKGGTDFSGANFFQKLYFHKLGTAQSEDVLVYDRPDEKDWGFSPTVTDDGRYLLIHVWKDTSRKCRFYYKDLTDPAARIVKLIDKFEYACDFIDNDGTTFWFSTDRDAPNDRVIAVDISRSTTDNLSFREVIPQSNDKLEWISCVGNHFFAGYLHDAHTIVKEFTTMGSFVSEIALPSLGSAGGFSGKRDEKETYYWFTNFTTPMTSYKYDIEKGTSTVAFQPKLKFNPDDYIIEQVFVKSKDGTRVPLFISHKKGVAPGADTPCYLYGYGGFNVSLSPYFTVGTLLWMEVGGIFAQACIRGGGEYGEEWHEGGTRLKKQNVFDDFISASEWLIANKYTSAPKLSIGGGSNGGLLVGACMTQRPDLFGAAVAAVGVLDMLRFHKFTIGHAWVSDYGSADDAETFKALYKYSPLHNLKEKTKYPATLILTGDHDDRVVPAHSFKFAAALQAAQGCDAPCLIRIETSAGHGMGKPTDKIIDEGADKWAFLVHTLALKVKS